MPGARKILLHLQLEATAKSEEYKDKEESHPRPIFEALARLAEATRHSASLPFELWSWLEKVVVGLTGDCLYHHERRNLSQVSRL